MAEAQDLVSGNLDIAVLHNAFHSPSLPLVPLLEEELLLVQRRADAPARKRARLAELADLEPTIPSRPNAIRTQVEIELIKLGIRPRIALESMAEPQSWTWWPIAQNALC